MVLNSNMAIKITYEMKQWINIAILRHASFPVGKPSEKSQKNDVWNMLHHAKVVSVATDTHKFEKMS